MTTSIMFCTYNRLNFTKRMLESFFQNTTSPYHLVIVDNGSTDGTPEYLNAEVAQAHLIHPSCLGVHIELNSENQGIAKGRNRGLAIAQNYGDAYLATLDNDIELPEHWLEDCLDVIKANPRFAVGINFEGINYPLETLNGKMVQVKAAGNLGTACSVFSRHLFASIGYFNTEYGFYGEEDADYFFRARMVGYKIGYLPIKGVHFGEGPEDSGPYREFKTKQHALNLAKFRSNCYAYMSRHKAYYLPYSQ